MNSTHHHESSFRDHEHAASKIGTLGFAVVTLSDTRTQATDASGQYLQQAIHDAAHRVVSYQILPDDADRLSGHVRDLVANPEVAVVITSGGTGISKRDASYEAITRLLQKRLDGFGELFRMLSFQEIGAAAMATRSVGGLIDETLVFAMPGSTNAVRLGMEKLILPQVTHLCSELRKHACSSEKSKAETA